VTVHDERLGVDQNELLVEGAIAAGATGNSTIVRVWDPFSNHPRVVSQNLPAVPPPGSYAVLVGGYGHLLGVTRNDAPATPHRGEVEVVVGGTLVAATSLGTAQSPLVEVAVPTIPAP
jgi:hypothetical protein